MAASRPTICQAVASAWLAIRSVLSKYRKTLSPGRRRGRVLSIALRFIGAEGPSGREVEVECGAGGVEAEECGTLTLLPLFHVGWCNRHLRGLRFVLLFSVQGGCVATLPPGVVVPRGPGLFMFRRYGARLPLRPKLVGDPLPQGGGRDHPCPPHLKDGIAPEASNS
jgi:hypothetical protein